METTTISTIEVDLNHNTINNVPPQKAIYALFEKSFNDPNQLKCRFVGAASDLKEAVMTHFSPMEPNIGLRYFMISRKEKYLTYQLLNGMEDTEIAMEIQHWIRTFKPDC
ncbi:MAG: hypothetical protein IH596_11060 [Bacteroidales bacterium]|nr:hypothetical protein [Bacteroidales bacterium]